MTHKNYALIPVLGAVVLIPQLLFWWLAPASAAARLAVYIGGTILTAGIPAACFVTYWRSGLRNTAGLAAVSGALELAAIALSALLLRLGASLRSAVFALLIALLVCLILLIPMIASALRAQEVGVYPADRPGEPEERTESEPRGCEGPETRPREHPLLPAHPSRRGSAGKPLPPRNR